jgi:hypothetical protein
MDKKETVKKRVKLAIKKHKRLLKIYKSLFRRPQHISYLSEISQFAFAVDWAKKLPYFDVYIGIPRKGLAIASIIATLKGRPLSTPENFVNGQVWFHPECKLDFSDITRVLLVEDSSVYGKHITIAKEMIREKYPNMTIKTSCLIVGDKTGCKNFDYYYMVTSGLTMLEGSLLTSHGWSFSPLATDIDGVLCEDCPANIISGTPEYLEWIKNVKPLLLPNFEILAIITSRLNVYRDVTEQWLKDNGVKYKHVYMRENESESSSAFKARIIWTVKPRWFWESSFSESVIIAKAAKIQVFSVEQNQMVE